MPSKAAANKSEWDKRIRRAEHLSQRFSYAAEILSFYRRVLEFQKAIAAEIPPQTPAKAESSFRERLDVIAAGRAFPALLSLVEASGPSQLADGARRLRASDTASLGDGLGGFLQSSDRYHEPSQSFFARTLLQPYAERLAATYSRPPQGSTASSCPFCDSRPQAAVLRPEGDGGKRFLLCCFCLTEWEFRRILCPICGEEDYQKLPRYSAEDMVSVRVEACDTCKYYLKSVDMTVDGLAVPLVDEIATVPLDLWATQQGYKKVEPNLMGF